MRARLFARFGPEDGLEVEFGSEATIGRGKDNTVLLSSREVSQRHARVFFDPESAAYWIEDLGSLNGSRLDGEPVIGRERLGGLHVLSFGATAELFFLELDSEPEEPEEPGEPEPETAAVATTGKRTRVDAEVPTLPPGLRPPASGDQTRVDSDVPILPVDLQAVPVAGRFVLEVTGGAGGRFELREGDNLVGRSGRAHVVLRNQELSRRHATLRVEGDRVWVRDDGSRNHTFVAGEEISEEVELEPGSELRFGRLEVRLSLAEAAAGEEEPE